MKLLFCESCATLVVPNKEKNKPTSCDCKESHVWWDDEGKLVIYGDTSNMSMLGIHNGLLMHRMSEENRSSLVVDQVWMNSIINATPDNFLFKSHNSLIVRFKYGATGDVRLADIQEFDKLTEQ